jgi:hypothetical protein
MEVLRVLDPPAQVLLVRVRGEGVLEEVQGLAVGAVADGVDAELVDPSRDRRGQIQGPAIRTGRRRSCGAAPCSDPS